MLYASDTPRPDETPGPLGDPPAPPQAPEGDPLPVKDGQSDELSKEGDSGDKLGDFA